MYLLHWPFLVCITYDKVIAKVQTLSNAVLRSSKVNDTVEDIAFVEQIYKPTVNKRK